MRNKANETVITRIGSYKLCWRDNLPKFFEVHKQVSKKIISRKFKQWLDNKALILHENRLSLLCVAQVSLILVLTYCILTGQQCSFEYRSQPPSTTLQGCNPYDQIERIRISLECVVRRQSGVNTSYSIRWFRESTGAVEVEDLGLGDPDQMLDSNDWFSRYHNTAFRNQPYSPSLLGKYWCQVINTTADPDQPLMRSNVFTLLAPEEYNGSLPCTGVQTVMGNITCASLLNKADLSLISTRLITPFTTTTHTSVFHTPYNATTPTQNSATQQSLVIAIVSVITVVIVITVLAVIVIVILITKRKYNGMLEKNLMHCLFLQQ